MDSEISVPVATFTLTYGLDDRGNPIIGEEWESYGDEEVPMLTKTGLLAMAQQTLMMDIIGVDDGDE